MASRRIHNAWLKVRAFWTVLRTERATPREIAIAVFVGALIGASPLYAGRTPLAAGVGVALKMNRLWCYVSSHFTANPVSTAWIALAEVQVSYRLRHGTWLPLTAADVLHRGFALIGDLLLGFAILGPPIAAVFAAIAWLVATWRGRRTPAPPASP